MKKKSFITSGPGPCSPISILRDALTRSEIKRHIFSVNVTTIGADKALMRICFGYRLHCVDHNLLQTDSPQVNSAIFVVSCVLKRRLYC